MTDAFVEAVTCATAARVADRCSNPNCRALTSGPHNDRRRSLTLGLAVHIAAASPSGRRYDPLLPDHEHGAYGNAIWLCRNCANLIVHDAWSSRPSLAWRASRYPLNLSSTHERRQGETFNDRWRSA